MRIQKLLISLVFGAIAFSFGGCQQNSLSPDVNTKFVRLDGSHFTTGDLKGKPHLIVFWATSCTTCVKEMPLLTELHHQFASQNFEIIAVAMQYDPPMYVKNFQKSRALPFTVVIDHDSQIAKAYGNIQVTPTNLLFDSKGQLTRKYVGEIKKDDITAIIGSLVQK